MVSDAQKIRLAIALTALRHKPANSEQSYEAYILDLRASFPLSGRTTRFDDLAASWRTRCNELQKKLHDLENKYQNENIEHAALRAAQCARDSNGKKKPTKRTKPSSYPESLKDRGDPAIEQETFTSALKNIHGSGALFSTLHNLDRLVAASGNKRSSSETEILFTATTRVLDALAQTFAGLLPPAPASLSHIGVVSAISTILARLLTVVLPIFASKTRTVALTKALDCYMDELLGRLLSSILLPALQSFVPLTRQHLTTLFRPNTQKRPPAAPTGSLKPSNDLRPAVFTLLRTALSHLQQLAPANAAPAPTSRASCRPIIRAVQSSLALCATRELEALYAPNAARPSAVGETAASAPCSPDRAEKLVRADALWYVCGVLSLTVPGTAGEGEGGADAKVGGLLQEGVCVALAGVLRGVHDGGHATCEGEGGRGRDGGAAAAGSGTGGMRMGVAEREMIMAVAESAWLSQG